MDDGDLVRIYWREASNRVGQLTDLWLRIEDDPRAEAAQELKRLLHTMKGEAHMLGLRACAELVRAMEEAALASRQGVPPGLGDVFLTAVDAIAVMASNEGKTFEGFDELVAQLDRAAGGEPADRPAPTARPASVSVTSTQELAAAHAEPSLLDPNELSPLVHEARRRHLEQALLRTQLGEIRPMLRALMAEVDPSQALETLRELERRIASLEQAWSHCEHSLSMALDGIDETLRAAAMVSVGALEAQVHRTARSAAAVVGKRVRVSFSGDAYLDATVERSLGPALLHLVRNAVDHGIEAPTLRAERGKPAEGSVEIRIQQRESSVHVRVKDDGGGVDVGELRAQVARSDHDGAPASEQELLQSIFEHGVTTRSTATELSGRGVGLDVVAKQVRSLGGTVRVESTPGQGTEFELVLPTRLRADVAGIGGQHVLVVENAPVARTLLLGLLRSFGLKVSDAADGRQGLARARQAPPDLILTDLEMPFLGGLEMIAELNADAALAGIPVVVLTTREDEEVRAHARALGVRAFLSKQRFVEDELRQVIDRCLAERE